MLTLVVAVIGLAMGTPIVFVLGLVAMAYLFSRDMPFVLLAQRLFVGLDSFVLLAIPFYVLMGNIMTQGRVADVLVAWAKSIVGRIRGGLAVVNILVSVVFAGISGSASADTSAFATVLVPPMDKEKYDRPFSCAVTISSSIIAPIIPPSIIMVVYAVVAEQSIAALFLAGVIPGLFMGGADIVIALVTSYRRKYSRADRRATLWEVLIQTKDAFLALLAPAIILGGILTGVMTPTEAGVVAVAYSLILSMAYYRTLRFRDLPELLWKTLLISCAAYLLVGMSAISAWALAAEQLPQAIATFILSVTTNKVLILISINCMLLLVGCLMEAIAAIILFVPIFLPLVQSLGVDPVHFGLIVCLNLAIGLITPPVGACLFIVCAITKTPMDQVIRATVPFLLANFVVLMAMTFMPDLVMWLPRTVLGP
jgi:C4-dicarboxylate transporter DctM subunit